MLIAQAHEQKNALIKGSGGTVGLTDNSTALQKWIISAPEQACFLFELENERSCLGKESHLHHEKGLASQKNFKEQVLSFI